ncbi:MAG TPA: thiosulfate oxidation carrier protein SoxY [Usitatibacter sp.]|nr:thiosulfate oxidation carrier protein SoxY [Usitatibacter sp.]
MALDAAMKRRAFIALAVGGAAAAALPASAQEVQDIRPLVEAITKGAAPEEGGIEISLPPIAENGHSVPFTVKVPSPMSETDHVSAIHVIAERNPRPAVATFHLGPWSGRAELSTRIRLAGTQKVTVVAALSGNRFRIARKEVVVESAACLDEGSLT